MKTFFEGKKLISVVLLAVAYLFLIIFAIGLKANNNGVGNFWVTFVIWTILFSGAITGMYVPLMKKLGKACLIGLFAYSVISASIEYPGYFAGAGYGDGLYKAIAILMGIAGILAIFALVGYVLSFAIPVVGKIIMLVADFLVLGTCLFLFIVGVLALFTNDGNGHSYWYTSFNYLSFCALLGGSLFGFVWARDPLNA